MKVIILFFVLTFTLIAQNKFDSLDVEINKVSGTKRIDLLNDAAYALVIDSTNKSLIYSKYAIDAADEINYTSGKALACLNTANAYRTISKFSDAIDYYKAAYGLYINLNAEIESAFCLKSIAEIYTRIAAFDKALDYSLKAVTIYQTLSNGHEISEMLLLIGEIYYSTGNIEKSLENFSSSYDISKALDNKKNVIESLSWLALIYDQHENEYEKAINIYFEALSIADSASLKLGKADVLKNLGKLYLKNKDFVKADSSFNSSLTLYEELGDCYGITENLNDLAKIDIINKQFNDASSKLDSAFNCAEMGSLKLLIVDNYLIRSQLFHEQGNDKEALIYYKIFNESKDSLFSLENRRQFTEIQTIYETEKKEKLIEIQALKLSEQQRKINLYFTIAVIITIASLIIYVLYRNYKHIAKFLRTVINSLTHPFYVIRTNDMSVELANTMAASNDFVSQRNFNIVNSFRDTNLREERKNWLIDKVVSTKSPFTTEHKLLNEKGENTYFEIQGYPIFDKKGNVVKMIEYSIDITSRKTAEEALIESEQKLRELNATKDKFFSIIAHDLKNPFSVILGYSEMLYEDFDNIPEDEKLKFVSLIGDTAQHSYNLLENLLNWARSQTGLMKVNKEIIDLNELATEIFNFYAAAAESKKIKIQISIQEELKIESDKFMLSTILRNLVNNAIKFNENEGSVIISAVLIDNEIKFSIVDTGIGLSAIDIQKLFRIDVNINTIGSSKNKGTGLGLILCREFIEKLDGKIWAERNDNKGSRFNFTIPQ